MTPYHSSSTPDSTGSLHSLANEKDNCGMGAIANINGIPSHDILSKAVESVCNMTHRGGVDADMKTGDGSGILSQIPRKLFKQEAEKLGATVTDPADLAVGVFFLPNDNPSAAKVIMDLTEKTVVARGLEIIGWREVPVAKDELGLVAQKSCPVIKHLIMTKPEGMDELAFERQLYLCRRTIEHGTMADEEALVAMTKAGTFLIPTMS
jgi:glutamate synthase (NADPH/NADH) large chain/glutamate synthase (ferredoxin)